MLNGFLSGLASTLATVPFQVIRTSMMVHEKSEFAKHISMTQIIKSIYKQEGFTGFFRGFTPSFIRIPIGKAIYFFTLERSKLVLQNTFKLNTVSTNVISSALGMGAQCILTNPLSLTATRLEAIETNKYKNMFDAFRVIYKEEGLIGFTKGLKPLLIKEVPSHVLFYSLFQYTTDCLNKREVFSIRINNCISAMFSSVVITILDNPFDLIRTRSQYQFVSKNNDHLYPSVFKALKEIYIKEGIRGLENGVMPRIMRKIASTTVLWTVYNMLNHNQKNKEKNKQLNKEISK